jgi:WD40 repeat protein
VTAVPESPFKGLNAFDDSELDALLFFGRERETEIVVANLIASRLTVLYGPSGVGKSSLLRAAVARSLRGLPENPLVVVFSSWSEDPNVALSEAVGAAAGHSTNGSAVAALEQAQSDRDVYLVLDQAEEYFLYHADDDGPASFAEALPAVLSGPSRVNVLVSLREDSLAKLDRFTGRIPGLFANTLRLDRLDRTAARAAILRPTERFAELTGSAMSIEPELVERVLDEVGTGQIEPAIGGLGMVEVADFGGRIEAPYLQLVMQRVWEEEHAGGSSVLRAETFARLGGAQRIVEEHLERAMAELSAPQKDVAARIFNHLVTPSGTKIAHEVSDLGDFGQVTEAELIPVLRALANRRILRSVDEGGANRYEIFHDVLGQPVLAWRVAYEADRELEAQKRDADRRNRRLLAIIGVAAVLLALMCGATAYALSQRNEAQQQAELASQNAAEAQKQSELASQNAAKADQQAAIARTNAAEAKTQSARASQSEAEAQQQAQLASENAAEAQHQAEVADQEAARAQAAEAKAKAATANAQSEAANAATQERAAQRARAVAEQAAKEANARALAEEAVTLRGPRPLESLRLALRAIRAEANDLSERVLRESLVAARVRHVLPGGGGPVSAASFTPDGRDVLTVADGARMFDAHTGALIRAFPDPSKVTAAAASPAARLVVTAGTDGNARVWPYPSGPATILRGHKGAVQDVVFSADGRFVATASSDRTAGLWDVASGERVATFDHDGPVANVEISPDGRAVLTVSRVARTGRRIARLFDSASGRPLRTFDQIGITSAIFSPDGTLVVTTSTDDTARVWKADAAQALVTLRHPDGNVVSAAFNKDGTKLVTATEGSSAVVWHVGTWEKDFGAVGPLNPATGASFSPNGRFLVVSSRDRNAHLFNADNGSRLAILSGHGESVVSASFSPDGRSVVTASDDGSARLWDPGTEDLLQVVGTTGTAAVRRVDVSPNGRLAVSAQADGVARIMDIARRRDLHVLRHDGAVNDASFSSDGRFVVTASDDGTARIWRVNGEPVRTLTHGGQVLRAVFSPDGALVVTAGDDHTARIWRTRDGALLQVLRGHTGRVLDVAFSPDGSKLSTAGDNADRTARIWDVRGRELHVLRHRGPVVRVQFSPDGRLLATASGDEMARLWRVDTGRLARTLRGHTAFVRDVAFRRDGKVLASAADDGDARTWDVRTGRTLRVLRGHFSSVQSVAFSPDGRWIVTGGPRTAGLWEAATGQFFAPTGLSDPFLRGPVRGPVSTALFTPDGRRLVTASGDGTVRTYLCSVCGGVAELVRLAKARLAEVERNLTAAERRIFLRS